jgi:hypothetical protein
MSDRQSPLWPRAAALALLGLAALPAAARAQALPRQPIPGTERPVEATWQRIEGVALAVDGDIVRWSDFVRIYQRAAQSQGVSSVQERDAVLGAVARSLAAGRARIQAGAELPLPDEQVETRVRQILEDQRDSMGLLAYGESMRADGLDPLGGADEIRQEFYRFAFLDEATGRTQLGLGRPRVDRYLRPRQLRAAYEESKQQLGEPPQVQMQLLDITAVMTGSLEAARELANDVHADLVAGADFDEQFELFAARFREERGRTALVRLDTIREPAMREFAVAAQPGDISKVVTFGTPENPVEGFRIVRLLERVPGKPAPPFTDPEFQAELRTMVERNLDDRRLSLAEDRRLDQSAVWVHPAIQEQLAAQNATTQGPPAR